MTKETKIAPPNSLILVMDRNCGEIPESMENKLLAATSSCIAVGTLSEIDGSTLIVLTDEKLQDRQIMELQKVFSGIIATPKKEVDVCTALLNSILMLPVQSIQTQVEIWVNSKTEPDKIYIFIAPTMT